MWWMVCRGVEEAQKNVLRGTRYLRSGDGVHLLIADWFRHLGSSLSSMCGWRLVEGGRVVGECSAELFGEMSEPVVRLSV
jgi:hypothetical protein